MLTIFNNLNSKLESDDPFTYLKLLRSRTCWRTGLILVASLGLSVQTPSAWAAGKKRQPVSPTNPTSPNQPPVVPGKKVPRPLRDVIVLPVSSLPFRLPNGSQVNLGADLYNLMNTSVAGTGVFQPRDYAENFPCESHLELRSAVTILELNVLEVGMSFGFSPSGAIPALGNITSRAKVNIGTIAMDFGLAKCSDGYCQQPLSATVTHLTAGINLALEIDFSIIKTGPTLIYNTPLGVALQSMMQEGMRQLVRSTNVDSLPWQAVVRDYDPDRGTVIFDAGGQSRIEPNQTFEIYSATDTAAGSCHVYKVISYITTTDVNAVSSRATVDRLFDTHIIRPGDVVMIRNPSWGLRQKDSRRRQRHQKREE